MPRPCACDRVAECRFCERWHTSEWHRRQWGGPAGQPPPPNPRPRPAGPAVVAPAGSWTHPAGLLVVSYDPRRDDGQSHAGLGVNGMLTAHALAAAGVRCESAGVRGPDEIGAALAARPWATHCTVGAAFVPPDKLDALAGRFPRAVFVPRCHSQLGFLQCESQAVRYFRGYEALARPNVVLSGNNRRFCDFWEAAYGRPCVYLPNPYPFVEARHARKTPDGVLDVGSFGSHRHLKNFLTAAGAALLLARRLGKPLRFHLNVNRQENQGGGILGTVRDLLAGEAEVVPVPWCEWAAFRRHVAGLDICLHPSFTETFSIVTADAVAEGVPVVGSPAIDWLPDAWTADPDDACAIASAAGRLLADPDAPAAGRAALASANAAAVGAWVRWLADTLPPPPGVRRPLPCRHLSERPVSYCTSCCVGEALRPYRHVHQCGHPDGGEFGRHTDGLVTRLADCEACPHHDPAPR